MRHAVLVAENQLLYAVPLANVVQLVVKPPAVFAFALEI